MWITDNEIVFSLDNLSIGIYNYTILVGDSWGNTNFDTIIVIVIDGLAPLIQPLPDLTILDDLLPINISWIVTDLYPSYYNIYLNGTELASDAWLSEEEITYILNKSNPGIYNFTILVFDDFANFAVDIVIITIITQSGNSEQTTTQLSEKSKTSISSETFPTSFFGIEILLSSLFILSLVYLLKRRK